MKPRADRPTVVAHVTEAREALAAGLRALVTGDDWRRALEAMAARQRLSPARYSFRNQCIIDGTAHVRGIADISEVATFEAWRREGRAVNPGERAIWILRPSPWSREQRNEAGDVERVSGCVFRAMPVFAVAQTTGTPRPEVPAAPDVATPDGWTHTADALRTVAAELRDEAGQPVVSTFEFRERREGDPATADGWYTPATRAVVVLLRPSLADTFTTAVHEVAHAILHGATPRHLRPWCEVEAESTAFVVCRALGLDTGARAFPYVATWAERTGERDVLATVERTGDAIAKAAGRILDALRAAHGAAEESVAETV